MMTLSAARTQLAALGYSIRRTQAGDYRVARKGLVNAEASAYYTNDLDDAVSTARHRQDDRTARADAEPWHGLTDDGTTPEGPEPWTVVSALPGSEAWPSVHQLAEVGARAILADPRSNNAWKMAAQDLLASLEADTEQRTPVVGRCSYCGARTNDGTCVREDLHGR
jgi:hypothetical protein